MKTTKYLHFIILISIFSSGLSFAQNTTTCGCDYILDPALANGVPIGPLRTGIYYFNPQPGQTVCLSGNYADLRIDGIKGTQAAPITIKNLCNTVATFNSTTSNQAFSLSNSEYVHITGTGDSTQNYGITIDCSASSAMLISGTVSKGIEIDHIEVKKSGFAGFMIKQDPTCDPNTWLNNMLMSDIHIHHNYVHDVTGEGFYIGNSFWQDGMSRTCNSVTQKVYPHRILGLKVHHNTIRNTGWDGLQYGCSPDAEVYNNLIENTGLQKVSQQTNGIQMGAGSGGLCYNNIVRNAGSTAIASVGFVNTTKIYNNLIINAYEGVFADTRDSISLPKIELAIYNNTLVNVSQNGLTIYDNGYQYKNASNQWVFFPKGYQPHVKNNVIIGPYFDFRLILRDPAITIDSSNNYKLKTPFTSPTQYFASQKLSLFADTSACTLKAGSYLINKGTNTVANVVTTDLLDISRFQDNIFDIGAYEFVSIQPTALLAANNINPTMDKSRSPDQKPDELDINTQNNLITEHIPTIYPTLATDVIRINLPESMQNGQINIYNIDGQQVKSIPFNERSKTLMVDIKDLRQGVYLCSFVVNHKANSSIKFSKW